MSLRNMMLTDDATDRQKQLDLILKWRSEGKTHLETLDRSFKSPKARDLLKEMQAADEKYLAGQEELLKRIRTGTPEEAKTYLTNDLRPVLANYKRLIEEEIKFQTKTAHEIRQSPMLLATARPYAIY